MAKRNGPTESSITSSTTTELETGNPAVSLSLDDWKNVLASMEVGIKSIGFSAFVSGGQLMENIQQQLNEQIKP
jgi:hypothetical protein